MTIDIYREHLKRDFVHREYLGSRVRTEIERIGHGEVREYFDTHANEFMNVDRVEWQDVFVAVGPKHPTPADARRFAEQLAARARTGEDFGKFQEFDEGDSRYRKGMGLGQRRGEIQPAEVERYIWNMRDGEIGPLIELSTGVHVFRLVKREYAGPMAFTPEIQMQILDKLRNEAFMRERKRILRELAGHAVVVVEREPQ